MKSEYVNNILDASINTLKMFNVETQIKKPELKEINSNYINIKIGLFGDINGTIILSTNEKLGCELINKMYQGMMEVSKIDDMGKSALAELGNMIAGSTATNLSNIGVNIDITTPSVNKNEKSMKKYFCVPLNYNGENIETFMNFS